MFNPKTFKVQPQCKLCEQFNLLTETRLTPGQETNSVNAHRGYATFRDFFFLSVSVTTNVPIRKQWQ